jgi:hypothetical protein
MDARDRQTTTLRANATRRATAKRQAAEVALERLKQANEPINFAAVAREAKVSRTYLYKNADLAAKIRALIAEDCEAAGTLSRPRRTPSLSGRLRLRAPQPNIDVLNGRIQHLEVQLAATQEALDQLRREHEQCPKPS